MSLPQRRGDYGKIDMSNMSYCKFHNTLIDLIDCRNTIEEMVAGDEDEVFVLSHDEARAAEALAEQCFDILTLLCEHAGVDLDQHQEARVLMRSVIDSLPRR
ncbi:hypothetical protein SAMN04487939_12239 [Lysobacter sp. yr284]|uniref:hypothetical protein n=1 Tax=Lysobacter sp. yr284 TaxID=1761791 RepID=UPI000898A85D|nr:hypothetical protein [Lysobacter sp. yr284]SDZ20181.1 hypothetical protein SAMN04487939_12239 [Lysobacter sp. yr284]